MARKKSKKTVSFDVMVKFFIRHYNIPTKKDLDRLNNRLDKMEQRFIRMLMSDPSRQIAPLRGRPPKSRATKTASDMILDIIKKHKEGIRIKEIKEKSDFEDKKLRNIVYRLHSTGKIFRIKRGVYTAYSDDENIVSDDIQENGSDHDESEISSK